MHGFYRIAAISPELKVGDVDGNTDEIIRCARAADAEGAAFALFPELCITAYSCGDLFHQSLLLDRAWQALLRLADAMKDSPMVLAAGLPVRLGSQLFNCAAILQNGKIKGLTPKTFLPNQREFYEKRHFSSGRRLLAEGISVRLPGLSAPVPVTAFYPVNDEVTLGVELCEDLWAPTPPSGPLAAAGANLILNLSASNALVAKSRYRRDLVAGQSARCMAVYAYASSGVHESTTDTVFGGHLLIAENGTLLAENRRFQRTSEILYADADLVRMNMQRISEGPFQSGDAADAAPLHAVPLDEIRPADGLRYRKVAARPFVPPDSLGRSEVCREIFQIQCAGLAKRLESSGARRAVIGLSGGLDSTLALLVISETYKLLKRPPEGILSLTMPGFGTTDRTKNNAVKLAELLGTELRTIPIRDACLQHFRDIGHDGVTTDVTYENVQARERTQILMDVANREGGLVIGTGDLSEIALGWSTYNADHMSMYGVNCGVPKTLVRHIVSWYAEQSSGELSAVLKDVVATPVSPELLPAGKDGAIRQKTEAILGSYDLHDFFLYHFIKYGAPPEKLYFLACHAFEGEYGKDAVRGALKTFIRRFFTQQFKRSCIPDGPKVGSVSLSPRADWRMPSDAAASLWLAETEKSESGDVCK